MGKKFSNFDKIADIASSNIPYELNHWSFNSGSGYTEPYALEGPANLALNMYVKISQYSNNIINNKKRCGQITTIDFAPLLLNPAFVFDWLHLSFFDFLKQPPIVTKLIRMNWRDENDLNEK